MTRFFKTARLIALTLALAVGSSATVVAQQGGAAGSEGTGGSTSGRASQDARTDRGFDYGWLGLIGLAGLIPLFVRRNGHGNHTQSATRGGVH